MSEHKVSLEEMLPLIQERLAAGQDVRFTPRGISMQPMLRNGRDVVVLSPVKGSLSKYDLPLYRREDGQFVLHRVVAVGKDGYTCIGDNQFVLEPGIKQEQVIAIMSAFIRNVHERSASDLSYKIYCRVWHWSRPVRHLWRRGLSWIRRNILK